MQNTDSVDSTSTLSDFLPMTRAEMEARGWDEVDFVFVSGDAYVDHPSFATALLGRVLEAEGFKVAILAQPDWHSCEPWTTFGRPRLGFCVSAGNMDSMINHYTANRKVRNDDAYSPGGKIGLRPDRATLAYCQRAREAYPGITVIAGGVEASLRRLAHYDYWSDKVRRSIVMDSRADILVYGMGEKPLLEIARGLAEGKPIAELREIRGTVYRLKASEDLPPDDETTLHVPSCEEVSDDKKKFVEMTRIAYENLNPYCAKRLIQEHEEEAVVVNPPAFPLSEAEMDRYYGLPFTKKAHPSYGNEEIPALTVIRDSVQILRGCFGGCAFCSLAAHQGKIVQSRSETSICDEVRKLADSPDFKGVVSDLGGPTANMYMLGCSNPEIRDRCVRLSCLQPNICPNLETDHDALIRLMRKVRELPNVKQVYIASGVRADLAQLDRRYLEELVKYHVGGHLKTAPEHTDPEVLRWMNKPPIENYVQFCELFSQISRENGKEQYLVPYLIAGLPGSTLPKMAEVAEFLHKNGIKPQQVQEFIPGPFELATCMYYTGIDPVSNQPVHAAHGLRERRLQKALLLYYDPHYYHDVKTALKEAGREDLIGFEPHCLIPPYPSKADAMRQSSRLKRLKRNESIEKERKEANRKEWQERGKGVRRQETGYRNERPRPFGENRDRPPRAGSFAPDRDRERGDRRQDSGDRRQETGFRSQGAGYRNERPRPFSENRDRPPRTGGFAPDRDRKRGDRRQESGFRRQESGNRAGSVRERPPRAGRPAPDRDRDRERGDRNRESGYRSRESGYRNDRPRSFGEQRDRTSPPNRREWKDRGESGNESEKRRERGQERGHRDFRDSRNSRRSSESGDKPRESNQRERRQFPPRKPRVNHGRPQRGKRTSDSE